MMLSKIINGGYDINYSRFVTVTNEPNSIYPTRLGLRTRFIIEKPRTRKEEQSFWYRAPATANRIATAVDFFNAVNLKARIIKYMWHYFLISIPRMWLWLLESMTTQMMSLHAVAITFAYISK